MIYEYGEPWWNHIGRRKTCTSATVSTTNPTWTDPGMNVGLHCDKPVTNHLSHMAWPSQKLKMVFRKKRIIMNHKMKCSLD
jgi:hypothetical protein